MTLRQHLIDPFRTMSTAYREYRDEEELMEDFREHWANPETKRKLPQYIFSSLVDQVIFSVVAEVHYQHKTGTTYAMEGVKEENRP